jgi:uncharacterized protein
MMSTSQARQTVTLFLLTFLEIFMPTDQLLSEQEFDELDRFLLSERCSDEAMTMDALHGYLTSIAIGPDTIRPAEWLPRVWGPEPEDAPKFRNPEQAKQIEQLILRTLEDIRLTFEVAPNDFEPLFCEHQWKGQTVLDAEAWAWGFVEGMSLRDETWDLLLQSPQGELLRAIHLLGAEEIEEDEVAQIDDPVKCHKLAVEIEASIPQIYRFWLQRRKANSH